MANRDRRSPRSHTSPRSISTAFVPGARFAGYALADLVAGPAEAIAIMPPAKNGDGKH